MFYSHILLNKLCCTIRTHVIIIQYLTSIQIVVITWKFPLTKISTFTNIIVSRYRSIYATFDHKRTVKGIDVYRFTVPPRVFEAASENADNAGFCSGSCLLSGVLNISVCKSGRSTSSTGSDFLTEITMFLTYSW